MTDITKKLSINGIGSPEWTLAREIMEGRAKVSSTHPSDCGCIYDLGGKLLGTVGHFRLNMVPDNAALVRAGYIPGSAQTRGCAGDYSSCDCAVAIPCHNATLSHEEGGKEQL